MLNRLFAVQFLVLLLFITFSIGRADDATPASKDCDSAVSTDGVTLNQVCIDLCKANDIRFGKVCSLERYDFIDTVQLIDNKCFTTNIYGYEDKGQEAAGDHPWNERGLLIENVKSASICQEMCQRDEKCAYFSWRHTSDRAQPEDAGNCLLKTAEMLNEAGLVPMAPRDSELADPDWTGHVPTTDEYYKWYQWCDMGLRYECYFNHYDCLKCPDTMCAYKSAYHVSGPKFCGFETSDCQPVPPTTTAPIPTTTTDPCGYCESQQSTTASPDPCDDCDCYDDNDEVTPVPDCRCSRKDGVDVLVVFENTGATDEYFNGTDIISLTHALRKEHKRVRVGLASFSDKPVRPFGSLLARDYCYRLDVPLVREANAVSKVFDNLEPVSGGDLKENQLGALVSAANDDAVVWKLSRRYVVLVTDNDYHVAGDAEELTGKKHCVKCTKEDYPSENEVRAALSKIDVTPIIAATPKYFAKHEDLAKTIGASIIDLSKGQFAEAVVKAITE